MASIPVTELDNECDTASSGDIDDNDAEGWEDVDGDDMPEVFVSLFDDQKFDNIKAMFEHCKINYQFDVWKLQQQYELDFIGLVKLVNYVRKCVNEGKHSPDISAISLFDDDYYLMPVMESDAVLYNLEDILIASRPIAKTQIEELEEQMAALQSKFDAYREDVTRYLGDKFENVLAAGDIGIDNAEVPINGDSSQQMIDSDYFQSYSFNQIHEVMLKDRVRTDAYRDFIYDNKDIFKDKVVLDVGCGTGILSMFCATAGAKRVIAVDNSSIINQARDIVKANKLDHKIQCIRGKIEEVILPVAKVDIIVSEWMGYCLLYESMFDSVIYARDRYLTPNGLMVPSHANLEIGILADSDLRGSHVDYWNSVYGFDMRPMAMRARGECAVKTVDSEDISGHSSTFRRLNLHTVTVKDLDFEENFAVQAGQSANNFDGFTIWFDIFFTRSPDTDADDLSLEVAAKRGITVLSTSPHDQPTHWQQGVCFLESPDSNCAGQTMTGIISFQKSAKDMRALNIKIQWQAGGAKLREQSWHVE